MESKFPTFDRFKDRLVNDWKETKERVSGFLNEQEWFLQAKERWLELESEKRVLIVRSSLAVVATILSYQVLSTALKLRTLRKEIQIKTDVLDQLSSATGEMKYLKSKMGNDSRSAESSAPASAKAAVDSAIAKSGIDATAITLSPEKPGKTKKAGVVEKLVTLTLKRITIRQLVNLSHALENNAGPMKIRNVIVDTQSETQNEDQTLTGYLDVTMALSYFMVAK
jgi:hypothetical protein